MKGKANRAYRLSFVAVGLSMFLPATNWLLFLQILALLVLLGHLIWMWSHD